MIKVFGQTDTTFTSNGDIVIQPLKAKIHKEDNGDYYLDLECGIEYQDYITEGRIVVANTPQGEQAFRIRGVTITGRKITTRCWHIFFDLKYYYFVNSFLASSSYETCTAMLARLWGMPSGFIYPDISNFTISSDITEDGRLGFTNVTLYDAIMAITTFFEGHLVLDNFTIAVNSDIGQDNGINIRYGSNLKEITRTEDWSNVCTRIKPYGKDGARLVGADSMDSTTQYTLKYTKLIQFPQDDIQRQWYSSDADYKSALSANLILVGRQYMEQHALPELTYTLKTYIDFEADIGDIIRVMDERLGVDILTKVFSYDYDCIKERYTDIAFGNYTPKAKGKGWLIDKLNSNWLVGDINGRQIIFNGDNTLSWI